MDAGHAAFENGREYIQLKSDKRREQLASNERKSDLFKGLVFFFDAFRATEDNFNILDMHSLVVSHGGFLFLSSYSHIAQVAEYLRKSTTHIIAQAMTSKKIELLRRPIVKPEWIFESIRRSKLLNWQNFRLADKEAVQGQQRLGFLIDSQSTSQNVPPITDLIVTDDFFEETSENYSQLFDPLKNNVKKFFENSRLHHLSTWKSSLIKFVQENQKNPPTTTPRNRRKTLFHVDLDCFFASVAIKSNPEFKNLPVAVAHSTKGDTSSTSEIASCNYKAREFGLKNGMILGKAMQLCKNLKVFPYKFEEYDIISKQMYFILLEYSNNVQAVSCDEALLDVTESMPVIDEDQSEVGFLIHQKAAIDLAEKIRAEVKLATGVDASVGISENILMAKMATKRAKPNGCFYLVNENFGEFIKDCLVDVLPSVGWSTKKKLNSIGITTCGDLKKTSLKKLEELFGKKSGLTLYNYCRGIDDRALENKERSSVSAGVNWGIRFESFGDMESFLRNLCIEVIERLHKLNAYGKQITVKLKKKLYEGEPSKFMGHGHCENLSKSIQMSHIVGDLKTLFTQSLKLVKSMKIDPKEVRGMEIQISKLDNCLPQTKTIKELFESQHTLKRKAIEGDLEISRDKKQKETFDSSFEVDPLDIDMEVVNQLPMDIRKSYTDAIEKARRSVVSISASSTNIVEDRHPKRWKGKGRAEDEVLKVIDVDDFALTYSQIDKEVFDELPDFIKEDIEKSIQNQPQFQKNDSISKFDSFSQIDQTYLDSLPPDILEELQKTYKEHVNILANPSPTRNVSEHRIPITPTKSLQKSKKHYYTPPTVNLQNEISIPTLSQIDPEVLNALSEKQKRDVLLNIKFQAKSFKQNAITKHFKTPPKSTNNNQHPSTTNYNQRRPRRTALQPPRTPTFNDEKDFAKATQLIASWVYSPLKTFEMPDEGDVVQVSVYLEELVSEMFIGEAENILKRLVKGVGELAMVSHVELRRRERDWVSCVERWRVVVGELESVVVGKVFEMFGSRLVI